LKEKTTTGATPGKKPASGPSFSASPVFPIRNRLKDHFFSGVSVTIPSRSTRRSLISAITWTTNP
jgi:hypothetical protein